MTYSHNHQACVGKETEAGPAKTVSESAGEAIGQLGEVWKKREDRCTVAENVLTS